MINKLWNKLEWRLLWRILFPIIWMLKELFSNKKYKKNIFDPFSIGMVTYVARFSVFKRNFINLFNNFSDTQIIICVNGYYNRERQEEYLKRINNFLQKYENVKIVTYLEPQSLSKLWNVIIMNAIHEKILICNDDIEFSPYLRDDLLNSTFFKHKICTINGSWSHFLISKEIVKKIGWFDERLFGVGGEDWDYQARLAFAEIEPGLVTTKNILNKSIMTKDFSYGKNIEVAAGKYTKSSADFLFRKWEITIKEDEESKYLWERYVKPVKGMETPNFYPDFFQNEMLKRIHK